MGSPIEDGTDINTPEQIRGLLASKTESDRILNLVDDYTKSNERIHYQNKKTNENNIDFREIALDLIHKLSTEVYATNTTQLLMQEIVEIITTSFPITFACIEKYNGNSDIDFSVMSHYKNFTVSGPRSLYKLEDTLAGEVIRRNTTLMVSNKNNDKLEICPSTSYPIELKHYIGIPIIVNSKTVGVFSLATSRNLKVDKESITWSETIGHHLNAIFTRDELMQKIKLDEQKTKDLICAINSPTVICDIDGNVIDLNESFISIMKQYFPYQFHKTTTINLLKMFIVSGIDGKNNQNFSQAIHSIANGDEQNIDIDIELTKGVSKKWFKVNLSSVANQQSIILMFLDITERKQVEEKLEYELMHDPTSGLANRTMFHNRLYKALLKGQKDNRSICVASIDVGRFSFIIESLGHDAADAIMLEASKLIQTIAHTNDLIARISSSEFAILFYDINTTEEVSIFANALIANFKYPFIFEDQEIILLPSIGITFSDINKTIDTAVILHDAHSAMTLSRESINTDISFANKRSSTFAIKKLERERELSRALVDLQLLPYYQPEIDLKTHKIIGAEALARWQHPKLGLLSPDYFIETAEESNLIGALFEIIFKQVLLDALKLFEKGHNFTLWTNISANQFQTHNISSIINDLAKTSSVPTEMIGIEITETALMKDASVAKKEFRAMKDLGIKLALDDFGTGYSSLSHLAALPVDMLKIDRSFIQDMTTNNSSSEIVSAVIGLAHGMKIDTLAEGIENIDQFNILNELGCNYGQGYLFSKALEYEEFKDYLEQ